MASEADPRGTRPDELTTLLAQRNALSEEAKKLDEKIKELTPATGQSRSEKLRAEVANAGYARQISGEEIEGVPLSARQISLGVPLQVGQVSDAELAKEFDLVVIGGGPAGVAACMKASFLGQRAIVVDKPKSAPISTGLDATFGGPTGLWSKALRDTAKTLEVSTLRSMKLSETTIWAQVVESCLKLATNNASNQVKELMAGKQLYLQAEAKILAANKVSVTLSDARVVEITAKNILVATGSYPLRMPSIPIDDVRLFDSDTVSRLNYLPKSVVITGSGIIAIEYAMIFRKLGAKVTILARASIESGCVRIGLDSDIADRLVDSMRKAGVNILEGCSANSFEVPPANPTGNRKPVTIALGWEKGEGAPSILCDMYLAAIGRVPRVKGFGLEELNVELHQRGHIIVDDRLSTNVPGIYACGDAIGPPSLASTGVHQGQTAVEHMFSELSKAKPMPQFPVGMWTIPEAGYFGPTKEAAIKQGIDAEEGIAPYDMCLRGRVFAPDGMLKLVFRKIDGVIIGVHIIGDNACEIIHYGMDLVNNSVSIFEVMSTLFTAVTFHELYKAAATQGNSKMEFGLSFRNLAQELGASLFDLSDPSSIDKEAIRQKFVETDKDGSGALDADEVLQVFAKLGKTPKPRTIGNLIRVCDTDQNGTIDWEEFQKVFVLLEALSKENERKTVA